MTVVLLVRGVHIVAGSVALAVGIVALAAPKGRVTHVGAGRVFMVVGRIVVGSALIGACSGMVDVESRVANTSEADLALARDVVPVFFALLGMLGLLASFDMERGFSALSPRPGRRGHLRWIAIANGLAGVGLAAWGSLRVADGKHGVSWFAIVVGCFGVETFVTNVVRRRPPEPRLVGHAVAMVDALFGFIAAFVLFGAGRALDLDFAGGDRRIVYVVAIVVGAGRIVSTWWRWRLAEDDKAPGTVQAPGASSASG